MCQTFLFYIDYLSKQSNLDVWEEIPLLVNPFWDFSQTLFSALFGWLGICVDLCAPFLAEAFFLFPAFWLVVLFFLAGTLLFQYALSWKNVSYDSICYVLYFRKRLGGFPLFPLKGNKLNVHVHFGSFLQTMAY